MMADSQLDSAVSEAWKAHREGRHDVAIQDFRAILDQDAQHMDALYGLGLAQKAVDDKLGAKVSFGKLRDLLQRIIDEGESTDGNRMQLNMVNQRLKNLE
jgi:hypothetical protein